MDNSKLGMYVHVYRYLYTCRQAFKTVSHHPRISTLAALNGIQYTAGLGCVGLDAVFCSVLKPLLKVVVCILSVV